MGGRRLLGVCLGAPQGCCWLIERACPLGSACAGGEVVRAGDVGGFWVSVVLLFAMHVAHGGFRRARVFDASANMTALQDDASKTISSPFGGL